MVTTLAIIVVLPNNCFSREMDWREGPKLNVITKEKNWVGETNQFLV